MTDTTWRVPPSLLRRFLEGPDAIDDVTASSIEAHVVECSDCRRVMSSMAAPAVLDTSWSAIADRIDRPRTTTLERLLERYGAGGGMGRLVAATPALRAAGLVSVIALAVGAALVSRSTDAAGPFLVIAPLLPLAAVGLSFAPGSDPGTEAALATPLHGSGLVVRRTIVILVVTFLALGAAALALPDLGVVAAAWALPALAVAMTALCLGTWWRIDVAVATVAGGWVVGLTALRWVSARPITFAETPAFTFGGQLVALAVALVAGGLLVVRREQFATLEVSR